MSVPEYFTLAELTETQTRLPNVPGWKEVENLRRLALFLDRIRVSFGVPIIVNSGYRSPSVNAKVGGVLTSAHIRGLAADIVPKSRSGTNDLRLLSILQRAWETHPQTSLSGIYPDQLIVYCREPGNPDPGIRFFHVGLSALSGRRQILWK